jgi:hypothetical protein
MPNGYDGSIEDWEKMEAPLLEIDGFLAQFAAERNMQVVKNYHNWPQRYLDWVSLGIHRSVQVLAVDASKMTFHVSVIAWIDKNEQRYLISGLLKKQVPWDQIRDNLHDLLEEGVKTTESWSEKDLKAT